jgi:hypothetical protein
MLGRLARRWRLWRDRNKPSPSPHPIAPVYPVTDLDAYDVLAVMRGIQPLRELEQNGIPTPSPAQLFSFLARQDELRLSFDLPRKPGQKQADRLRLHWPKGSNGNFLLAHDGEFSWLPPQLGDFRQYTNLTAIEGEIRDGRVFARFTRLGKLLPDESTDAADFNHLGAFRRLRDRCVNPSAKP